MTNLFELFIYYFLSVANIVIPKNKKIVVIYGRSMLNDNADALLDYMIKNEYYRKYKMYLLVRSNVRHNYAANVKVVHNTVMTIYYALRAKYIFHTHGLSTCKHLPSKGQVIFNLWHGSALKGIAAMNGGTPKPKADSYFLCASPMFVEINKKCFLISDNQVFIGSNPRNDLLFCNGDIIKIMGWQNYSHIIMYMPTFRKSKGLNRIDSDIDFPIINSSNVTKLDKFLQEKRMLLIIKPHPYQNDVEFLHKSYNNIRVLHNEDIIERGLRLYEILGKTDALLTDYSSVYFDYLLTGKPIGFTIDDYDDYGKSRNGFTVENPLEMMPGMKIYSYDDLIIFMTKIACGEDDYSDERKRINKLCNSYVTPDASKRILDFCGLSL